MIVWLTVIPIYLATFIIYGLYPAWPAMFLSALYGVHFKSPKISPDIQ